MKRSEYYLHKNASQLRGRFEKFLKQNRNENDCWIWQASTRRGGYGQFGLNKKLILCAHRASYAIYVGDIPDGMCVLHICDTPACVNPYHLFLGTHADNVADMMAKGRQGLQYPGRSGIVGVSWDEQRRRWRARVNENKERKTLYCGKNFGAACRARQSWKERNAYQS